MNLKNEKLYYVGGVVRDELLGIPSFDTDFCYEGNAIEFAKKQNLNIIKENPDFGTVRVIFDNQEIDIASTRCETYPENGHLPKVSNIGCSLKDDLSRRDFTINALAKNTIDKKIVDHFNGLEDLKNKCLRTLHDNSFIEDPSRIIRGLKFAIRFNFELEENTKKLQDAYLSNINYDQSYHRLKKELRETFSLNKKEAYTRFINQGIYKLLGENQSIPEYNIDSSLLEKYYTKNTWLVYLAPFDLNSFELTSEEKNILEEFNNIKNTDPKNDFEIYKLFNNKPVETVLIYGFSINKQIALKYLEILKDIKTEITGKDLLEMGISQGVIYKEIFDYILNKKIENPNLSKRDEINLVKEKFAC